MKKYDLIIIGTGAGLMVLEEALAQGYHCAIIEKNKFGGTCLTKGCIPSKMLVYPADLIRETEEATRIGLDFKSPIINWEKISKRLWKQINYSEKIEKEFSEEKNLDIYKGTAEFVDDAVSYTHLRAHETVLEIVCRLLLEQKKEPSRFDRNVLKR